MLIVESHFRTIIYFDREKRIFTEANLVSIGGKKLRNSVLRLSFEFHKGKDVAFTFFSYTLGCMMLLMVRGSSGAAMLLTRFDLVA